MQLFIELPGMQLHACFNYSGHLTCAIKICSNYTRTISIFCCPINYTRPTQSSPVELCNLIAPLGVDPYGAISRFCHNSMCRSLNTCKCTACQSNVQPIILVVLILEVKSRRAGHT